MKTQINKNKSKTHHKVPYLPLNRHFAVGTSTLHQETWAKKKAYNHLGKRQNLRPGGIFRGAG